MSINLINNSNITGTLTVSDVLDINGTSTSTFAGPISITPPSSTGWQGLTITGSGSSHTQGSIVIKSGTGDTPEARGQGIFMFNEGDDSTWYTGTQYQDADTWMLGRVAGASLDTAAATTGNAYIEVSNNGAVKLSTIAAVGTDTDKFLMSNNGTIAFATGAEVLSFIGAGTGSGTVDGSGTANKITKWSDSDTVTDSSITDDGTDVNFISPIIITDSLADYSTPFITLWNDTNGGGAGIEFSDQATTQAQKGYLTFYHSDGASQGGGASMHLTSTETDFVVVAGGPSTNGRFSVYSGASNAEPDYGFYDDQDTGMLRPSANALRFVTGGTAALDLDSSQNATFAGTVTWSGGGSSESNSAYDNMITGFSDSGSSTITLTLTQQDGGTLTTSFSNPQGTVTSVGGTTPIASSGGTTPDISISNATGTTVGAAAVDAGTGISVSDSSGVYTITNTAPATIDGSGAATRLAYWSDSDTLTSNAGLTYAAAEHLTTTSQVRVGDGSKGAPSYSFDSDRDTGMYSGGTDIIAFSGGGNTSLLVKSDEITAKTDIVLDNTNIVLDTSVSSTQSSGTIIKIGSHMSALVAGNIYYAGNSMGNLYWYGADADSSSTENMLALSLGTDADVDGMLLNGIYHKASHGLTVGEPIYLSTTPMLMTNTAPSGSGDYVRVLGYAIDSNRIYFSPDNTWVKID
jgi:hypothetical protein